MIFECSPSRNAAAGRCRRIAAIAVVLLAIAPLSAATLRTRAFPQRAGQISPFHGGGFLLAGENRYFSWYFVSTGNPHQWKVQYATPPSPNHFGTRATPDLIPIGGTPDHIYFAATLGTKRWLGGKLRGGLAHGHGIVRMDFGQPVKLVQPIGAYGGADFRTGRAGVVARSRNLLVTYDGLRSVQPQKPLFVSHSRAGAQGGIRRVHWLTNNRILVQSPGAAFIVGINKDGTTAIRKPILAPNGSGLSYAGFAHGTVAFWMAPEKGDYYIARCTLETAAPLHPFSLGPVEKFYKPIYTPTDGKFQPTTSATTFQCIGHRVIAYGDKPAVFSCWSYRNPLKPKLLWEKPHLGQVFMSDGHWYVFNKGIRRLDLESGKLSTPLRLTISFSGKAPWRYLGPPIQLLKRMGPLLKQIPASAFKEFMAKGLLKSCLKLSPRQAAKAEIRYFKYYIKHKSWPPLPPAPVSGHDR